MAAGRRRKRERAKRKKNSKFQALVMGSLITLFFVSVALIDIPVSQGYT